MTRKPCSVFFDYISGYRVNFVGICAFVGMELQNVAWLALITAELLPGENNLLSRIMQSGISERDLPRIL